jgi:hypothetical protein
MVSPPAGGPARVALRLRDEQPPCCRDPARGRRTRTLPLRARFKLPSDLLARGRMMPGPLGRYDGQDPDAATANLAVVTVAFIRASMLCASSICLRLIDSADRLRVVSVPGHTAGPISYRFRGPRAAPPAQAAGASVCVRPLKWMRLVNMWAGCYLPGCSWF